MTRSHRSVLISSAAIAASLAFALAGHRVSAESGIRGFFASRVDAERQLEEKLRAIPDAEHAESDLHRLTSEPHMAGTEASHRVAQWLQSQYQSFGFDAAIVSYSAYLPHPGEIHLDLVAPEKKSLASPEEPFEWDKDSYDQRAVPGFNSYSPSGDVTAPVVYANYGMPADYHALEGMGISVEGKIVLARYGGGYRGVKAMVAEEHKAAGLLIYSDPSDDGYDAGDVYPRGPWRPMSGIQRGSILYTQLYPGDPLTPGVAAAPDARRLAPSEAASLPKIPTLPINAQDAAAILAHLGGVKVPHEWQGGLPMTYHLGPGESAVHLKLTMNFQQHTLYDVIARLPGTSPDEWVVLGNHHDAWVFGAVDPNSGTTVMLETARALGELARAGWKPRRTIVMAEWDGEEFGLLGSTEWVEDHLRELQSKAVAYINTDVGVSGPNFGSSATPSLKELVREVTRQVPDPRAGHSVFDSWKARVEKDRAEKDKKQPSGIARSEPEAVGDEVPLGALGAGSDFCAFLDYAGIPSLDIGFGGDYGVYHSLYDDFFWMKHFGDPDFAYHAAAARILGTLTLRLDEADVLPFDYAAYASEISKAVKDAAAAADKARMKDINLLALNETSDQLTSAASKAMAALQKLEASGPSPAREPEINRALVNVEQAFLLPGGLQGRSWFKHSIYAPGKYAGYAAVVLPGLNEAIERNDMPAARLESVLLSEALQRATARLNDISRLASQ